MKTTNTNAFLLIVTSSNLAQFPISWMLKSQRMAMTAGMSLSVKFLMRAMVCMLLLVLSGCKVSHSIEDMPQELKAVSELEEPMEKVAALDPTLKAVAALDAPLKNVAELKTPMEQVAALDPTLKEVAALDAPLKNVAELKTPMEQVAALDPTLKAVAALDAPLKNVAELKAPLVALGAMATITQPTTYVPMFGFVGIVLFLAIWGGIKMGRR
ncbi:MAG: hypothetical protein ACYSOL_02690 [Planctomycetota bacterium]|jgi:hypothetical protein